MNAHPLVFSLAAATLCLTAAIPAADQPRAGEFRLSGPYTKDNLTIYLVHGNDRIKGVTYLTLQEALAQKKVIVHETGDVNQLAIENVSGDTVYVQSGDIVKGGQQDRTIASDFICPPHSGKMPINAFCVEHGRWTARGGESAGLFGSSENSVAGKDLKLAAVYKSDQGAVWQQVAANQDKLSDKLKVTVNDPQSATSFQLALENKKLQEAMDGYVKELTEIVEGKPDTIGYAFALNGKVNSADVYASHELFRKLWPKLLKSASVEAIAENQQGIKFDPAKPQAVQACVEDAEKGKAAESTRDVTPRVSVKTRETRENVLLETTDRQQPGAWVHRSYITKDQPSEPGTEAQPARGGGLEEQQPQAPNPPAR